MQRDKKRIDEVVSALFHGHSPFRLWEMRSVHLLIEQFITKTQVYHIQDITVRRLIMWLEQIKDRITVTQEELNKQKAGESIQYPAPGMRVQVTCLFIDPKADPKENLRQPMITDRTIGATGRIHSRLMIGSEFTWWLVNHDEVNSVAVYRADELEEVK